MLAGDCPNHFWPRIYPKFWTGKSCLYLSGPDNARDGKTFHRRREGALPLETINAPSNRAWKITSERKKKRGKEKGRLWRKELFVVVDRLPYSLELRDGPNFSSPKDLS